jgi:2-methylisocitrate lyase-like PEP mutase family enzyme
MRTETVGMDADQRGRRLRAAISERRGVLVPGAANALTARIIEDLGFEAVYVTGAGIANTNFGVPDLGLVTMTEIVDVVAAIADSCDSPLIVDADTGFGNPLNVIRAVRSLERAGANALQLEDQVFPKRCGHFAGKGVVAAEEMVMKIKAAVDTRRSSDLLIIARTDARAVEGLSGAIERAQRYAEAGADATFVEAPTSVEELRTIAASIAVPQLANMVVGGQTPLVSAAALATMGFAVVLYANAALQAAIQAMRDVLGALRQDGTLERVYDRVASFETRQQTVNKADWDQLSDKYSIKVNFR